MEKMVGGADTDSRLQKAINTQAGIRAAADPLPGPLSVAFLPPCDIEVESYRIRPIVAYDWAIMKRIGSPIYRQMLEVMQNGDKAAEVPSEPEEMWDLIFLLTRPCMESDALFKKGGLDAFREAAKQEIGMKNNLGQILALGRACTDQIYAHMQTMVQYAAKENGDGEVRNFPSAEPTPATGSAGG
jgi:hypothetical protein